jgi:hypothetical protein
MGKSNWSSCTSLTHSLGIADRKAFAQLPIIIALAGKNNIVSFLTGVPYQELNYLHRASGRLCLLCSWIHTIGWIDGAYGVGMTGRFGYTQYWILWVRQAFQFVQLGRADL